MWFAIISICGCHRILRHRKLFGAFAFYMLKTRKYISLSIVAIFYLVANSILFSFDAYFIPLKNHLNLLQYHFKLSNNEKFVSSYYSHAINYRNSIPLLLAVRYPATAHIDST